MKIKNVILTAALSLFAIGATAQFRPSVIVSAGYQGANLITNQENSGNKVKSGFRVGAALDFAVADFGTGVFSIQPGLYYSTKGAKYEVKTGDVNTTSTTTNLGYIEMPILANVMFGMGNGLGVFINAGPYLAYGVNTSISGDTKTSTGISWIDNAFSGSSENTKNLFKGDKGLKPFDAGIQVGAGVEYRRFQVGVGTQFGLVDMSRLDKVTQKNSTFFVSLGYRF